MSVDVTVICNGLWGCGAPSGERLLLGALFLSGLLIVSGGLTLLRGGERDE